MINQKMGPTMSVSTTCMACLCITYYETWNMLIFILSLYFHFLPLFVFFKWVWLIIICWRCSVTSMLHDSLYWKVFQDSAKSSRLITSVLTQKQKFYFGLQLFSGYINVPSHCFFSCLTVNSKIRLKKRNKGIN